MKKNSAPSSIFTNWKHFLACGFGSGASPWAPGTMGTVAAIPLYILVSWMHFWPFFILTCVMFTVGVWLCEVTSRDWNTHDHSSIVWDEIVGYFITMFGMPFNWKWIVLGFVFFRLFDIWKPWPISIADKKIKGGFGIMFDDVLAAIYALIVMHMILLVSLR